MYDVEWREAVGLRTFCGQIDIETEQTAGAIVGHDYICHNYIKTEKNDEGMHRVVQHLHACVSAHAG